MIQPGVQYTNRSPTAIAKLLHSTSIPQTIYVSPGKWTMPVVLGSLLVTNILFWGNLSQWVYQDYNNKDEKTGRFEKAPIYKRVGLAGLLAATGLGISTGIVLFSRKIVKRMDVIPGSKVRLYPGVFTQQARGGIDIPIQDLMLTARMYTGEGKQLTSSPDGHYAQMRRKSEVFSYIVDRRGYYLSSPKVFDALFWR